MKINKIYYSDLLNTINFAIENQVQLSITGANVSTINLAINDSNFKTVIEEIDIIHPDGIGVYFASKFLYGKDGFSSRMTGSDFYNELIEHIIKNNWSIFFFGDRNETLIKISKVHPELDIKGMQNGYNYEDDKLINEINNLKPDILLVGLGSPKQENWIIENKADLNANIIIAVGDGIKIFSNTKRRGPKIIQNLGLEWAVRLFSEPKRLWKRYLIGNPLFIIRILKYKLSKR